MQAILIELTLRFAKGASVAATLRELYLGNRGHWRVCKESHFENEGVFRAILRDELEAIKK